MAADGAGPVLATRTERDFGVRVVEERPSQLPPVGVVAPC